MDSDVEKSGVIVVGVDGFHSVDALSWAAHQAMLTQATLKTVMAWTWPTYWGREPVGPPGWDPEEEARSILAEAVEAVLGPHPKLHVHQEVVEGHAVSVLIAAAEHADLLVVGSRGHGAFAGILLGSVSMHCIMHARCPVVVVHPSAHVEQ